ncbi:MAG TPA: DNA polymerase Y family protein [Steroidobacteraceae bacterium]|jgi:protein ImuB
MSGRTAGLWLCVRLAQLVREASPRAAMERLAAWAYQWSSLVHYQLGEQPLLWLELGASARLFGGHAALIAQLQSGLTELGYEHHCALAPSPTAAALLTRIAPPRCVSTRAQLRARLEPLPLTLLGLPDQVLAALHSAGLRCIGQVLALPAAAIARRFGPESSLYLRRLCARAPDPRPAWPLPASYRARFEFDGEVHDSTALLFPLRRLLLEFQGYLRGRDCAVLRFTLRFEHQSRNSSSVIIGLSAPARDAAQFLLLVRERLHNLTLAAPVRALSLEALEFTAASVVQADFFGSDQQQLQQLQLLLDRLQARLGEQQVQGLRLQADYRPERAWQLTTPQQPAPVAPMHAALRPCTLLRQPRRIEPPARLLSGPERIESGWWDGADAQRDYYVARSADGARLWVFHDLTHGDWYLQGLWT